MGVRSVIVTSSRRSPPPSAPYSNFTTLWIADVSSTADARILSDVFAGDFFEGFSKGTKNAIAEITDFGKAGEAAGNRIIEGGFNGLSDAFADALTGTKKLKDALKDFARSFVSDLARIITRLLIVRSLSSIFGGGGGGGVALEKGGVVQGNMGTPVRAFASGGVTNGPTMALFGEGRNREAFVPLPDNRTIPVTLTGGSTGGDTHVYFNVSAIDARSVQPPHHGTELVALGLPARRAGVARFRAEVADGVVTPVVAKTGRRQALVAMKSCRTSLARAS